MRNLKISLDVYIEQMCMCDSWKGDGDPLNTLMAIGHEA